MDLNQPDYSRVLQPQADGYDSLFFNALKQQRGFTRRDDLALPRRLDGRVYIGRWREEGPKCIPVAADSPYFDVLEREGPRLAPVFYRTVTSLVDVFSPIEVYQGVEQSGVTPVSPYPGAWVIMASIGEHPVIALRNLMHELMHLKLLNLGFGVPGSYAGSDGRFIRNDSEQLHHSIVNSYADTMQPYMAAPVGRPMGACIHAYASFLAVASVTVQFALRDAAHAERLLRSAGKWTDRMPVSLEAILRGAQATPEGEQLLAGLSRWTEEHLLQFREASRLLGRVPEARKTA